MASLSTDLSGLANIGEDLAALEKYLPAIIALVSGSASETIPLPAESFTFSAGSFGKITVAIPAVELTLTKTA